MARLHQHFLEKCPKGGTAMFAFFALAGDLGAMESPSMVGTLAELPGGNLKAGLLVATLFPVALVISLIIVNISSKVSHKKLK